MQLVAAGFVLGRYTNEKDLLKLIWLPISERRDHRLACLAHRALYIYIYISTPSTRKGSHAESKASHGRK